MLPRVWIVLGALSAAASVGWGAYHAHALEKALLLRGDEPARVERAMHDFDVAVRYQALHAVAFILVGLIALHLASAWLDIAAFLFALGTLLFCGCLQTSVLLDIKLPWFLVPAGGLAFILGWLALAVGAAVARRPG